MNGVKRDGTMVDMLLPPLLLVTTYTTTMSTFPPGLVAGGRAGRPSALVAPGPYGPPKGVRPRGRGSAATSDAQL